MSTENAKDMINWVEHETVQISRCNCGEHHFHLIKVGSAIYLQCGRCGKLISIILDYQDKKKVGLDMGLPSLQHPNAIHKIENPIT